ncbi:GL18276 [Drosophila persimilis]|uniref:GL18276 n=1 Tax=Drosophila persimilis TaxID=7234 RepID=B4H4N8_DROPE|nr:GL18276 [Drosophila persimilis]
MTDTTGLLPSTGDDGLQPEQGHAPLMHVAVSVPKVQGQQDVAGQWRKSLADPDLLLATGEPREAPPGGSGLSSESRHMNTLEEQVPHGTGDLVGSADMRCDETYGYGTDCASGFTSRTQSDIYLPQQVASSVALAALRGGGLTGGMSAFEDSDFGVPSASGGGLSGCGSREYSYSATGTVASGFYGGRASVSRAGASLFGRASTFGMARGRGLVETEDTYGRPPNNNNGPADFNLFRNQRVSDIVTFIIEIMGVLVFFAICTISFWITLGYYVVKLFVDLKDADKWVQTAAGIVVGVLLLAFFVTVVTNREGGFCCRGKSRVRANSKWTLNCFTRLKSLLNFCPKAAPKACKAAAPVKPQAVCPKAKTPTGAQCTASSSIMSMIWPQKVKPLPGKKPIKCWLGKCDIKGTSCPKKVRYSDKQGRAIFKNSKRYAIPCEMKQPPALIVWLHDVFARLMGY